MSESKEIRAVRGKRKIDCLTENKETVGSKEKGVSKVKVKVEFENDEDFEKYLLSTLKKKDESEYILSDIVKNLFGEMKKYKTIQDMAEEIKKLALYNISNNLKIICNNECTSSFFIERFRVKYINEQNRLDVKMAQNSFKEFMVLYKNNDFEDFNLELNTNVGGSDMSPKETNDNTSTVWTGTEGQASAENKNVDASFLTNEKFYSSDVWKEKIKFKIQNINDNNNVLFKILKYLYSVTVRIENVPSKLKKFDIVTALEDVNIPILNINMWDVYLTKPNRSIEFFRKAIVYVQNKNDSTKLINLLRDAGSKTRESMYTSSQSPNKNDNDANDTFKFNEAMTKFIKWKLDVKKNMYNYLEFRLCPPICSHEEIIAKDYENAKIIVKMLDKACSINSSLLHNAEESSEGPTKKRKIEDAGSENEKIEKGETQNMQQLQLNGVATEKNENEIVNTNTNANEKEEAPVKEAEENNTNEESYIVKLVEENKNIDISKKLDILILYLRFVHNFCFYSLKKFNTYDEMVRECGHFFFRVNLKKAHPHNLIPTFYENFDAMKVFYDDTEKENEIEKVVYTCKENNETHEKDGKEECNGETGHIKKEDTFSKYQLKWRKHFEKELNDVLKMNYYEHIDIEKTEEFSQILKKNYILSLTNSNEIRCAKCKKLFLSIKDVPNHIFMKHVQAKLQLITETEIEIMKKKFFEAPHSFHFLHMMERKYNSMMMQQNNSIKGINQKKNRNVHLVGNHFRNDFKNDGNFDNRSFAGFDVSSVLSPGKKKQIILKKNDFYDDT